MNDDLYKLFHPGKNMKRPSLRYYLNEDAWHAFDSKGKLHPPTTAQKQKFCSMLVEHTMKFQSAVGSFFFATPPTKKKTVKKRKKANETNDQRLLPELGITTAMKNNKKQKTSPQNEGNMTRHAKNKRKPVHTLTRQKKSNLKRHRSDPTTQFSTACYKYRGENWNPP